MDVSKTNNSNIDNEQEDLTSLKGTMASLGILLAFIIVSWISIFCLYMSRV